MPRPPKTKPADKRDFLLIDTRARSFFATDLNRFLRN